MPVSKFIFFFKKTIDKNHGVPEDPPYISPDLRLCLVSIFLSVMLFSVNNQKAKKASKKQSFYRTAG